MGRTDGETDRRQKSNLVHFRLKILHMAAIILLIFLIINWTNFVYLLVYSGFLSPLLNFYEALRFVLSYRNRMGAPDRHNGQREASLCPSVRLFVRLLDGVWHCLYVLVYTKNRAHNSSADLISNDLRIATAERNEFSTGCLINEHKKQIVAKRSSTRIHPRLRTIMTFSRTCGYCSMSRIYALVRCLKYAMLNRPDM